MCFKRHQQTAVNVLIAIEQQITVTQMWLSEHLETKSY